MPRHVARGQHVAGPGWPLPAARWIIAPGDCHGRGRPGASGVRERGMAGGVRAAERCRSARAARRPGRRAPGDRGLHDRPRVRVSRLARAGPSRVPRCRASGWRPFAARSGSASASPAAREIGRASGWLGRAQRLLDECGADRVERGYLLLPVVFEQEAGGDLEAAAATAAEAATIGRGFGDADLFALAAHEQGHVLIRLGRGHAMGCGCSTRRWWRSPPASCPRSSRGSSTAA